MSRSVLAIGSGFAFLIGSSLVAQATIATAIPDAYGPRGELFDTSLLMLILALGTGSAIAAGFLTATIARRARLSHAVGLAAVTVAASAVAAVMLSYTAPLWFHVALQTVTGPAIVLGGWLHNM